MFERKALTIAVLSIALASHMGGVSAQQLNCTLGTSERWNSGWCDLEPPVTFSNGICLKLGIGGTATKVVVRILGNGQDPNQPVGIATDAMSIPTDRQLIINLKRQYPNSSQVSVHGGKAAWHIKLGDSNGPATLDSVEQVQCAAQKN